MKTLIAALILIPCLFSCGSEDSQPSNVKIVGGAYGTSNKTQNNANCLSPDVDPTVGGIPALPKPGKITVGTPAHVDCTDPKANCGELGVSGLPVGVKPIKDKNGHLDCSNPAVTCVSTAPEPEASALDKGCAGEKKPVDVLPDLSGLGFGTNDGVTDILCQLNPSHSGCEKPIFSGTPIFGTDGKEPKILAGGHFFLHTASVRYKVSSDTSLVGYVISALNFVILGLTKFLSFSSCPSFQFQQFSIFENQFVI
ncbi:MAG: hypothetical protein H7318_19810 [Oligoflexus sp.]|nr:hypothetical protein [Oligoflexus sp.]